MLDAVKAALEATGYPVAHFAWDKAPQSDYIVYAEDGAVDLFADNKHAEQSVTGTVDLYTKDDTGAPKETVEAALNASGAVWYLNTIQYEDDTGYIHMEWVVSAYGA